jgi:hypothetical protein
MFVLCLLYKDSSMENTSKLHEEGGKDLKDTKWIKGKNGTEKKSRRGHGCLSVESVVCCQVEVSESGWSLVQRSPTECGVSKV